MAQTRLVTTAFFDVEIDRTRPATSHTSVPRGLGKSLGELGRSPRFGKNDLHRSVMMPGGLPDIGRPSLAGPEAYLATRSPYVVGNGSGTCVRRP